MGKISIRTINTFLIAIALLVVPACISVTPVYYKEDKKIADVSVNVFHNLLNDGKFEELYELTDARAKAIKNKEDFINIMKVVHDRLGNARSTVLIKSDISQQASYRQVRSIYKTQFDQGERLEEFVWFVNDGKAGLFSYAQKDLNNASDENVESTNH